MMMNESRDIDDILTLKLAIEPTEATRQSLNELSGLADEILETIVKASKAFDATEDKRQALRETLVNIDADGYHERAVEETRLTARQSLDTVATADLSRAEMVPDTSINPQLQATDIDLGDVIEKAQTYESLHARGLDADPARVDSITDRGGVANVLSDTLSAESGGLVDQLSVFASRMGQSLSDTFGQAEDTRTFADTLEGLPESAIERLVEATQETAESTKKLADRSDEEELKERGIGAPRTPTEQSDESPTRQRSQRPSKPPDPAPPVDETNQRFTAGQQIEGLLGVQGRDSFVNRLQKQGGRVSEWGERLSQINTTLNAPQDVILDGQGNPILGEGGNVALDNEGNPIVDSEGNFVADVARSAALVNAGSRAAGATGLGTLGTRVSQIGSSIAGVASRFAVPLAIGAGAYTAIDRGVDALYETSQGGYAQGETGWDAFTTGFRDNMSDTLRGWNPFTPESSDQLRRYRENAINNSLGIRMDDDRFDTLIDTQTEAGRRGLRPEQAIQLYGQAIVRDEDFDINESLDDLAEGAKEAGVSLQSFADMAVDVANRLDDRFDISDPDRVNELVEMLNENIFDAEEGFLGRLDDREKAGVVDRFSDYSTTQGQMATRSLLRDEDIVSRMEGDDIDMTDRDAMLEWAWGGGMSPDELQNMILEVATEGMPEGLNQERQKEWYRRVLGVNVPSGRLDMVPSSDGISDGSDSDWRITDIASNVVSNVPRGSGGGGGSVDITIHLDEGLSGDIKTTQDLNNTVSGNSEYEDMPQSGRTGLQSFNRSVNSIIGG